MKRKVLIVDDVQYNIEFEETMINSIVQELGIEEIEIHTAFTLNSAIEKISDNEPYDAMFIDMNLPDGSGVDIAKAALNKNSNTRIAALTIYPSIFEKERAFFDLFLKKPMMPDVYKKNFVRLLQI